MSLNAPKGEKKQRPIPPIGAHVGVCFQIIDCGTHLKSFQNKEPKATAVLQIGWEFVNLPMAVFDEQKGPQPMAIFQEYTTSVNEKSKLAQALTAWRGVAPTDLVKELPVFLGQPCLINVIHNPDKQIPSILYANIANGGAGIMRLPQGMQVGQLRNPKMLFNLDTYSHDQFLQLPVWLQNKIKNSLDWSGIVAKYGQPPQVQQNTQQNNTQFQNQVVQNAGYQQQNQQNWANNQAYTGANQNMNQTTVQPVQNVQPVQQNQQTNQAQGFGGVITGNPLENPPF